nr:reverse transcriptase domain-containing protein [Tanacetum cinerariifolium]
MNTRSSRQEPTSLYLEPEHFIHRTKKKPKKRNPFIPVEDRVPRFKYPPFENLYEAEVVYNPFLDLPFPLADDQPMWGNNRVVAPTLGAAIIALELGDNFNVKGNHHSMIKDHQFDGRAQADPHKHIAEFIEICGRDEATFRKPIIPPAMFDQFMGEIRGFTQNLNESLVNAWLRMKELLHSFHRHGLGRGTIIQIFYHGLDDATQAILDDKGIFLYKTPNEAYRLLKDRLLLKLDWSKDIKSKPLRKTIAFAEGTDNSKLMEKIEALTTKIDSQFKEIKGEIKEMRDGCNNCGGPQPSSECDDKPMGGPEEEANYVYGGYRGNYYGRNFKNWRQVILEADLGSRGVSVTRSPSWICPMRAMDTRSSDDLKKAIESLEAEKRRWPRR